MRVVEFRTPRERAKGLQFLPWIEDEVIYFFPNVGPQEVFHSRNVPESFDLAFLDPNGVVLESGTMTPPHDLSQSPSDTQSAIEAKAGRFKRWGIIPGQRLIDFSR